VTGRYTSSDPNLQNIPTDPEFRGFFRAPEGRLLVDVDYSQLELRVLAARSDDTKMITAFEDGGDYHDLVAKKFGCTRRQAKAINFGIIYGKGIASLAADLGVDPETAAEYLRGWDEQAPVAAQWRSERPDLYARERGVRTARRWIDYLDDDRSDVSVNTRPMNFPVQGGAADVMHRAMRLVFERYRDWPGNVLPVLTIHDEILLEVDADLPRKSEFSSPAPRSRHSPTSCRTDLRSCSLFPVLERRGQTPKRTARLARTRHEPH
jgi:DNA polymerase-1